MSKYPLSMYKKSDGNLYNEHAHNEEQEKQYRAGGFKPGAELWPDPKAPQAMDIPSSHTQVGGQVLPEKSPAAVTAEEPAEVYGEEDDQEAKDNAADDRREDAAASRKQPKPKGH